MPTTNARRKTRRQSTAIPSLPNKPISAYAVAQAVVRAVQDEPKRLSMDDWGHTYTFADDSLPACRTVACIGGWIGMLTVKHITQSDGASVILLGEAYPYDACSRALTECFYTSPRAEPGTARYVTAALKPFRAWMKKYRTRLTRRTIDLPALRKKERHA